VILALALGVAYTADFASPDAATAARRSAVRNVAIRGFAYVPERIIVSPGTTVVWTNEDSEIHTVRSLDGLFASGELAYGDTYAHRFDTAGTYGYFCEFHPDMVGSVLVAAQATFIYLPMLRR
jgi:plastocyanin